jgi:DNA-binding CsgD family transcriptional regulator
VPVWLTTAVVLGAVLGVIWRFDAVYPFIRRYPWTLLSVAAAALAVSAADDWIRSGFYYPLIPVLAIAAVLGGRRVVLAMAAILAIGNLAVADLVGFGTQRIAALHVAGDTIAAEVGVFFYGIVCILLVERQTRLLISAPLIADEPGSTVVADDLDEDASDPLAGARLTPDQQKLLTLLPFGLDADPIGNKLGISATAVRSRLARIRSKLGASSTLHLVKVLCDMERRRALEIAAVDQRGAEIRRG